MLSSIEETFTLGQSGHVQVAKSTIWTGDVLSKKESSLIENHAELESKIRRISSINTVSGRANGYVLLINEDKSVGAFAIGFDPKVETNIEKYLTFIEGKSFSENPALEILVGSGIQKSLQLKIGQTFTVLSQTLNGSMSSIDIELKGVVKAGLAEIDNTTVYLPLSSVQKLLGTERVERIAILLKKNESLINTMESINELLKSESSLQAKPWTETAPLFKKAMNFFSMQNLLVEAILFILVLFGIINTLGMSFFERMSEIGTMRALGDTSSTVLIQLVLEGILLGILGVVIAIPISFLCCWGFSALNFLILIPGASKMMPVHIEPVCIDYVVSGFVIIGTSFLSSLLPAYRAVSISIIDSLRANS